MKTKIPKTSRSSEEVNPQLRDIAYSMDALIPGFYIWLQQIGIGHVMYANHKNLA
jgi:hypothetical protein